MRVPKSSFRRWAWILIAGLGLLVGCASGSAERDLVLLVPDVESRLETAPPTARDAMDEGLRWIAEDASETRVEPASADAPPREPRS